MIPFDPNQLRLLSPELVLGLGAILLLALSVRPDGGGPWAQGLAILSCVVTLVAVLAYPMTFGLDALRAPDLTVGFGGMFLLDSFSIFFKVLFLLAGILTLLVSGPYLERAGIGGGEYYALILFALIGMMLVASSGEFLTLFLSLETMALSFYPLVGYARDDPRSGEAAMKYFLLGSLASGILLYGISLIYAMTGTTSLGLLGLSRSAMAINSDQAPFFLLGIILITAGLAFKTAAAPFHMWAPDTYEGAPTPITLFLSTASKAAAFAALLRVFTMAFARLGDRWAILLILLAVASMTIGNLAALLQDNVKRMLAYSSIGHAGYALLGLIAVGLGHDLGTREWGLVAVSLYLAIYTFVNAGAFALVAALKREGMAGERVADFAGLARRSPWAAFAMLVFMLSLAGIPATAGFIGKWYLFGAVIRADAAWLAVVAVLNSVVSLYFYVRVVVMMYMRPAEDDAPLLTSPAERFAIAVCALVTLFIGVYPQPMVDLARRSILVISTWTS
ncbi:MAG TPA: NADH-quinone oxidoreductase subunit N [Dongiaceae bacterium]|nr:NADH-quinone oxidoreductase subunit N [Dongiaceae bacterium]